MARPAASTWEEMVGKTGVLTGAEMAALDAIASAPGEEKDFGVIVAAIRKVVEAPDSPDDAKLRALSTLVANAHQAASAVTKSGSDGAAFLIRAMKIDGPVGVAAAQAAGSVFGAGVPVSGPELDMEASQRRMFLTDICTRLCKADLDEVTCQGLLIGLGNAVRTDATRMELARLTLSSSSPSTRGISIVAALVDPERHTQVQVVYQSLFVLWLLTFTKDPDGLALVSEEMDVASVPRRLITLLREVSADKIVRVSLATLRGLATKGFSERLRREMVGAGLVPVLEELGQRRWPDADIEDDLTALTEAAKAELQQMSTFEVYRHEVLSGALEWSPVHKDAQFWRENAEKLEENKQEVLRSLANILRDSNSAMVLAVACHDLGEFIKTHPRGRSIAQKLRIKPRLMELMSDSDQDPEVRRLSLKCAQILMVTHWDIMQRNQ